MGGASALSISAAKLPVAGLRRRLENIYKNLAVFATLAVFLLSVSEIADPCCAVFLGHKSVPDTALCRSHGA